MAWLLMRADLVERDKLVKAMVVCGWEMEEPCWRTRG